MTETLNAAARSWRTTLAGVAGFVAVLATNVGYQFDADPLTIADWGVVAGAAAVLFGLIMARDNVVSSEEARS